MPYVDELEPLIALECDLRRTIAVRIAEEAGQSIVEGPSEDQMAAADRAIEAWSEEAEAEHDLRAFRPLSPLQKLLADHLDIWERILDIRDRRLS